MIENSTSHDFGSFDINLLKHFTPAHCDLSAQSDFSYGQD